MTLHPPFEISSRLMPAVRVGDAFISLELGPRNHEGRTQYHAWIDLPDGSEHEITDLRSGCQGGSIVDGMASLLCFLSAAGESRNYRKEENEPGENEDLFVPAVVDWASEHTDDFSCLEMEIEESETPLIED